MYQATIEQWNRFTEAFDFEGETNFRLPFSKLTKHYGVAYIDYLRAAWASWTPECGSVEDFCRMNGGVPLSFFSKYVSSHNGSTPDKETQ